jgi:hypothetical protein
MASVLCEVIVMRSIVKIWLALLVLFPLHVLANTPNQLNIQVFNPDWMKALNQNFTRYILLSGVIDSDAPRRLESVLSDPENHFADVYLDSPGGDLLAGIKLGRLLREANSRTVIGTGRMEKGSGASSNLVLFKSGAGRCFSACALAFLGGEYRWSTTGSEYGVHRFSSKSSGPNDLALAQILSAAIAAFIREMGVSGELFDYMSSAGSQEILIIPNTKLLELRVINNGRKEAVWSIEAVQGGQYLRGEQDSIYGKGKLLFICDPKSKVVLMTSMYEAGAERASQVLGGGWFHSLMTDAGTHPLDRIYDQNSRGDELTVAFLLTPADALKVASTRSVGHAMQLSRSAPTYVGYQIDISDKKSRDRVRNFLTNCVTSF